MKTEILLKKICKKSTQSIVTNSLITFIASLLFIVNKQLNVFYHFRQNLFFVFSHSSFQQRYIVGQRGTIIGHLSGTNIYTNSNDGFIGNIFKNCCKITSPVKIF